MEHHEQIMQQLKKFQHIKSNRKYNLPSKYTPPIYGKNIQMTQAETEYNTFILKEIEKLQKAIQSFLFYDRVTDSTMLHTLNLLTSAQSEGEQEILIAIEHFLNYFVIHPNVTVRFRASDMILKIHSDASYLKESGARSRVGGCSI